jgi:hypothetical protein
MWAAAGGAGGVSVGCWLLALGCWLAVPSDLRPQTTPTTSGVARQSQACGPVIEGTLKCPRFGFSYKIPFGWVDRTADIQKEDADEGTPSESSAKPGEQNSPQSETLLSIFERPPGAPGEAINSAVLVAAEPLKNYPRIKTASDYFGPIAELAEQRGFKTENEPYSFGVGAKHLVREDFSQQRGKLNMRQSSLVMIEKGYIVSFTFLTGDEDRAEELIGNLSFTPKVSSKK